MVRIHYSLLAFLLALASFANAMAVNVQITTETGTGCTFGGAIATQTDFNVNVYAYTGTYDDLDYLANGYASATEQAGPYTNREPNLLWSGGPFVLQYTGYFKAPESGLYVLRANRHSYMTGGAMIWLGSDMAFECCQQQIPSNSVEGHILFFDDSTQHLAYVQLEEGVYYPMRIVIAAESYWGAIQISMVTPSRTISSDWYNYVVQMSTTACSPAGGDTTSVTSESTAGTFYWTGSNTFTSTYVFTTTDSSNVVHVVTESAEVVPQPSLFTTDVPSTTTVVTEYTAIDTTVGATPYVTTATIVLVPSSTISESTSATFYWTGSSTFTSTYFYTTTDSSNVVHILAQLAEVVPQPSLVTTDVPSTTTVVTEYTAIDTTVGATPYVTTATIVLVPSSTISESTSATFYWTGSSTFTSTYFYTTTDSSNVVHILAQLAEVVPQPSLVTTDVPSTTTVVTEYTVFDTTVGATPYVTTATVVLVPTVAAAGTTSITSEYTSGTFYWTGSSTFTSTYFLTTTDGSNVAHILAQLVEVIPQPSLVTSDVPSNTTVVTEYTAIDTTVGATPYVTTVTVVLVPRSSAGSNNTSNATGSNTRSSAPSSNTTSSAATSNSRSSAAGSNITSSADDSDTTFSANRSYTTSGASVTGPVNLASSSESSNSGSVDAYVTNIVTKYTTVSCDLYWSGKYEFSTTFIETTTDVMGNPCVVTNFGAVKTGTPTIFGAGVSTVTTIGHFTTVATTSGISKYVTTGTVVVIPAALNPVSQSASPSLEFYSNNGSTFSVGYSMLAALFLSVLF